MSDRNVLDLALEDQRQARDRIEELRQQIVDEEARIEAIDGFVATYRDYEQRLGNEGSATIEETVSGNEAGEPQSEPQGEAIEAEANGAAYAAPYSSYRPYGS